MCYKAARWEFVTVLCDCRWPQYDYKAYTVGTSPAVSSSHRLAWSEALLLQRSLLRLRPMLGPFACCLLTPSSAGEWGQLQWGHPSHRLTRGAECALWPHVQCGM